jgi:hypothetical protein
MQNPYQDAKDLGAWKWMLKYHKRKMLFSFLFIMIFIVAPWVGQWRIDELWLRLLISGSMLILNFVATIVHPWTIYRDNIKAYHRWQKNYEAGMFDKKDKPKLDLD